MVLQSARSTTDGGGWTGGDAPACAGQPPFRRPLWYEECSMVWGVPG